MGAQVKVNGLKEVQAYVNSVVKNFPKVVDKTLEAGVRDMVRDAKADAPVDMGALKGQITAKRNQEGGWSMVSGSSYSAYEEFGTKGNFQPIPGIDASQFRGSGGEGKDFFKNILRWVERKGIAASFASEGRFNIHTRKRTGVSRQSRQKENERVAFLIMMSIKKHGVKPHPFFFKQLDKHGPLIIAQVNSVMQSVING
jgi:hypothetical protein